jgi:hypothetical protein
MVVSRFWSWPLRALQLGAVATEAPTADEPDG